MLRSTEQNFKCFNKRIVHSLNICLIILNFFASLLCQDKDTLDAEMEIPSKYFHLIFWNLKSWQIEQ
ncbi:CLUMA_CG019386, isoform A [Clunio marinus]|uniref:CLUMA_CG019386, isoform A n=1 Tax=Clunio marinus TaxID=568069 RepID=A0A1J1J1W0_9DIPT|nr:CLUMA_CG019386, isoform A [Clunio marinus]